MKTLALFFRLVDVAPESKAEILREVIESIKRSEQSSRAFAPALAVLGAIPTAPFAYWAPSSLLRAFDSHTRYESDDRTALQGASTCDDFRYVRTWFEVPTFRAANSEDELGWVTFAKGGRFSRFYADVPAIVNWNKTRTSFHGFIGRSGRWNPKPVSADHYLKPGLTWPLRGVVFSCSMLPPGCAYSVGGKVALAPINELPFLAAVFNSCVFNAAISLFAGKVGGFQYETGVINLAPIPKVDKDTATVLASCSRRAWALKRSLDTRNESSHAFTLPALLQVEGDTLDARARSWAERVRFIEAKLTSIQAEIDARCFDLYGIDESDRRAITEGFRGIADNPAEISESDADTNAETDDQDDADSSSHDVVALTTELVSWAVGAALGRFDARLAIGVRSLPTEPEPFDALPVCSPSMLVGDDGLPIASAPAGYPFDIPGNGILMDDAGHSRDLTASLRTVFFTVFGEDGDAIWDEAATLLDSNGRDLPAWVASKFFDHHLKCHSKSKRKAPIIWQFGSESGRYSVWLYGHRLTCDTLFQLQNDVIGPKVSHEERQLTSLVQTAGGNPSAKERNQIAAQETFVGELRAMLDELKRVTPLWRPTLDDGVVLAMAPLWRLVPQNKTWQKELKSKWAELAGGEYDWAHLAMHLWPERVVPKCVTDRSLAIAHGLEDVFWIEGKNGKWGRRPKPTRAVEEIVNERTSPAVKAALKSLLDAPQNSVTRGRRQRKATASSLAGDE